MVHPKTQFYLTGSEGGHGYGGSTSEMGLLSILMRMHCFSFPSRKKIYAEGSQAGYWLVRTITILCFLKFFPVAIAQEGPQYETGVVVVQFDSTAQIASKASRTGLAGFDRLASKYQVYTIERAYPFLDHVLPTPKTRRNLLALRRTYYVRYHAGQDPVTVAREFSGVSGVVYAEPVVVNRLHALDSMEFADPNDPEFRRQSEASSTSYAGSLG